MSVVAVVPVKPLAEALGRLGGVLGPQERRALQAAMLRDVLGACRGSGAIEEVLVVSGDPEAGAIAAEAGARVVADHDPPMGMNAAVALGLECAGALGARAALVLTADLPCARAEDLDALVIARPAPTGVVLSPSLDGTGTNAMLIAPPGALRPELGIGSLARHLAQVERRRVAVELVRRDGLALDVDTPDDLIRLSERPGVTHAHEVCARLGLLARRATAVAR